LRTRAIPERLRGVITTRRYTNSRLLLPLPHPAIRSRKCQHKVNYLKLRRLCLHNTTYKKYFYFPICADCPADFTRILSVNGCYKVVTRNLEWSAAGLECRSIHKDAHLLVINDEQEQRAVAGMLASINGQYPLTFSSLSGLLVCNISGAGNCKKVT